MSINIVNDYVTSGKVTMLAKALYVSYSLGVSNNLNIPKNVQNLNIDSEDKKWHSFMPLAMSMFSTIVEI